MGFLDFLFGKKPQNRPETFQQISTFNADYETKEYFDLITSQPFLASFQDRPYDFPKYNDSFETNDKYKLRELLLLVWWGRTKSGRKLTASIPKYFFTSYNLNAELLTRAFIQDSLLDSKDDKVILTAKGKALFDKYQSLWEIHSFSKHYPTNLDFDFPIWDKDKFELRLYQVNYAYYSEYINFCKRMIDYFIRFNPSQDIPKVQDQINYFNSELTFSLTKCHDLKEKITVLENAIHAK